MSADPKDPAELWVVLDEGGNPKLVERLRITALAHSDRYQHVTPYVPKADLDAAREELASVKSLLNDVHAAIGNREAHSPKGNAHCVMEWIGSAKERIEDDSAELELARAVCEAAIDLEMGPISRATGGSASRALYSALARWKESRSRG